MFTMDGHSSIPFAISFYAVVCGVFVSLSCSGAPAIEESNSCPLQCRCFAVADGLRVTCEDVTFNRLPKFPQSTGHIALRGDFRRIQSGALSALTSLSSLNINSRVKWNFEENVLVNLHLVKHIVLVSKVRNEIPQDAFQNMTISDLTIQLKNSNIPYRNVCSQQMIGFLDLSRNDLKLIRMDNCMTRLTRLKSLTLSENPISKIGEHDFYPLRNSQIGHLALTSCKLSTIHSKAFRFLPRMIALALTNNFLQTLSSDVLAPVSGMKWLVLSQNRFRQMPCEALGYLTKLERLFIGSNKYIKSKAICQEFEHMTNLWEIRLEGILIPLANHSLLSPLNTISYLRLTAKEFADDAFIGFNNLTSLELSGGKLNYINFKNAISALKFTYIKSLEVLSAGTLEKLGNDLFEQWTSCQLETLTMIDSGIWSLEEGSLTPLTSLRKLDLSFNQITQFPRGAFSMLKSLTWLNLQSNMLVNFALEVTGSWGLPPSLQYIQLSDNRVQKLKYGCLDGLDDLEILLLTRNKVSSIRAGALYSSSLQELSLSDNSIKHVSTDAFKRLLNLHQLTLDGNDFTFTEQKISDIFQNLSKLEILTLRGLRMSKKFLRYNFPHMLLGLTNLFSLDLGSSGISVLPFSLFEGNRRLSELELSRNGISTWNPDLFRPVPKLSKLILSHNNIMAFKKELFRYLVSLRQLDLSDNPLYCNCDLLWFRDWLPSVNIYIPNIQDYKCVAPDRYKNVQLLAFTLPESECRSYAFLKLSLTFAAAVTLVITAAGLVYR